MLRRLQAEKHLKANVEALLVVSGKPGASAWSPADKFPLAEYAPYKDASHSWNPSGTGISNLDLDMPIFHLEEKLQESALDKARHNEQRVSCWHFVLYSSDHARFGLVLRCLPAIAGAGECQQLM